MSSHLLNSFMLIVNHCLFLRVLAMMSSHISCNFHKCHVFSRHEYISESHSRAVIVSLNVPYTFILLLCLLLVLYIPIIVNNDFTNCWFCLNSIHLIRKVDLSKDCINHCSELVHMLRVYIVFGHSFISSESRIPKMSCFNIRSPRQEFGSQRCQFRFRLNVNLERK